MSNFNFFADFANHLKNHPNPIILMECQRSMNSEEQKQLEKFSFILSNKLPKAEFRFINEADPFAKGVLINEKGKQSLLPLSLVYAPEGNSCTLLGKAPEISRAQRKKMAEQKILGDTEQNIPPVHAAIFVLPKQINGYTASTTETRLCSRHGIPAINEQQWINWFSNY